MCRVLEDVEDWHRGIGEAVDEDSFQLALDKVEDDKCEGKQLCAGSWRYRSTVMAIEKGTDEVDERVDEDRTEVFNQEDCSPCYLRA